MVTPGREGVFRSLKTTFTLLKNKPEKDLVVKLMVKLKEPQSTHWPG
jgi:hypothetical protein